MAACCPRAPAAYCPLLIEERTPVPGRAYRRKFWSFVAPAV